MRAIIYRRVSSEEQKKSGLGLSAQLQTCTELAKKLGASEIEVFTDSAISGSTGIEERAGLREALAALKKDDILLVARRDRIARDMLVTLSVEQIVAKRKATLVSAAGEHHDDPVTNLIVKTMSDLFAQIERTTISSRTRNALKVKIAKGELVGNIKYGYRLANDKIHLIPNRREQKIIDDVRKLRSQRLSLRAIAAKLNDSNVRSRNGNPWQASQVLGLLKADHGNKSKAAKQGRV
jgi:DNA invertase Pin-like site-specific DNA recombinase